MAHAQQPSTLSMTPTVVVPQTEKESPVNSVIYSTSPATTRFPDNHSEYSRPEAHRQATASPSSLPIYIPDFDETRPGKMLIVCFDGTGDQFDADNSNIVQLVTMLKKDDKTKQMVYYQVRILFLLDFHCDSCRIYRLALGRTSHLQ